MRVLVTFGTRLGGTEGIARIIREVFEREGFEVVLTKASNVNDLRGYHAAIIGGTVFANRWHRDIRRFVAAHAAELRGMPVWLYSSGPLDDSTAQYVPPAPLVAGLMERLDARGHATFSCHARPDVRSGPPSSRSGPPSSRGGPPSSRGGPVSGGARRISGEWQDTEQVVAWANDLVRQLRRAGPCEASSPRMRTLCRMAGYGVLGWACCAAILIGLFQFFPVGVSIAARAALAPVVFGALAAAYFRKRTARAPLPTALTFAALVGSLDLLLVGRLVGLEVLLSFAGMWLPLALILLATWVTGVFVATTPLSTQTAH